MDCSSITDFQQSTAIRIAKKFRNLHIEKPLSSGQKWFQRPYVPLIRGMFLLRSGLRFLFRALEVPGPRVRKMPLLTTGKWFFS